MSLEAVKAYLKQYDLDERVQEFSVQSATVEQAVQAVGCEPARIAKTLSFRVGEKVLLIVAAGDARVDNAKFKAVFSYKAKMLRPDEVEQATGHAVGGVCPFAVKPGVSVYLDQSLKRFKTVFPACGSANSAIELTLPELETSSQYAGWVDVCKGWEQA